MAKPQPSEVFTTLKGYVQKLSDGERTPAEIGAALNDWAKESAESVKSKIHEEVESVVLKMGFIKREEFDALAAEVAALKKSAKKSNSKKSDSKKSAKKSNSKKSDSKKSAKRSTEKKDSAKKVVKKTGSK
jgi:BMFP domain-containing protein YqiC